MPRFYFHLYDPLETLDLEGRELPDLDAAFREAILEARAVAGFVLIGTGQVTLSHRIDITDEQSKVLASVGFSDAVRVRH